MKLSNKGQPERGGGVVVRFLKLKLQLQLPSNFVVRFLKVSGHEVFLTRLKLDLKQADRNKQLCN